MFHFKLQHRFQNIKVNKGTSETQSAMTSVLPSSNLVGGEIHHSENLAPLRAEFHCHVNKMHCLSYISCMKIDCLTYTTVNVVTRSKLTLLCFVNLNKHAKVILPNLLVD